MLILSLTLLTLSICIIAAITDILAMKIPNILVICILCTYAQYAIANYAQGTGNLQGDALAALILFTLTTILFFTGIIGGGDAKLISALGFWIGLNGILPFLFAMSVAGLGVGLLALALKKALQHDKFHEAIPNWLKHPKSWVGQLRQQKNKIPYGIAIACGVIVSFHVKGLLVLTN